MSNFSGEKVASLVNLARFAFFCQLNFVCDFIFPVFALQNYAFCVQFWEVIG